MQKMGGMHMYKRFALYVAAAVLGVACAVAASAVFTITAVSGSGMEPAIADGSKVLVNKLAYHGKDAAVPEVGSVVAFRSEVYGEEGEGSILVRRIAASGGDMVAIKNNIFYRNGEPYEEYMDEAVHMEPMDEVKLADYEIFVLSDNRKSSMDSRNEAIGILDIRDCIGKVCFQ